ncbi:MAG: hypothetical protein COB02_10780 [Candidatus Cloacimonadota bacterium]|nr:MAG: hypothetical protein COB02_10780 [Candidatus Cloacimonadota bacterium]
MLVKFADWLSYDLMGLDSQSQFGGVINFFIYDSIKIIGLLFLLILFIGIIRTYLPQNKIKHWMSKSGGIGNIFASMFGAITPFCSCSSVPLFLGFLEAGVPLGVTFSFLITSPIINEYLVIIMFSLFGWKITLSYVLCGLLIGSLSGFIIGKLHLEQYLEQDFVGKKCNGKVDQFNGFKSRFDFGLKEAIDIVRKIWIWVLVGVAIGSLIHNYVPQETIQSIINKTGVFSVPIATALGVPMYGGCATIVPIAVTLFQKGVPLGTALAFMMAIAALSLPEAIMLRRAMKPKLILIFFGITTVAIIIIGYFLNFVQAFLT